MAGEADRLVRACARKFEPTSPTAAMGPELVAAHVTVLWPFLPPVKIDNEVRAELRALFASQRPIAFALTRVESFPGGTVYVQPDPEVQLLELMHTVWQRWPETPPYGGVYQEVRPHVTLAVVADDAATIDRIKEFAQPYLPINACAEEVVLLLVEHNRWRLLERFPLGR